MMKNEIWKPVVDFEGLFEISNMGRLKSLPHFVHRDKCGTIKVKGQVLKPGGSIGRYPCIRLAKNKERTSALIHRLVAVAFIPNPENKPTINHINGIKTDNRVENLEWNTWSENNIHAFKTGLNKHVGRFNEQNHRSRSIVQIDNNGHIIKIWPCIREAARNGFILSLLGNVLNGRQKLHKGYKWKYYENIIKPIAFSFGHFV